MTECTHQARSGTKVALACLGCDQTCHYHDMVMVSGWSGRSLKGAAHQPLMYDRYNQPTSNIQVINRLAMRLNGCFHTIPGTRQRQSNLGVDCLEGRVADREAGLT